MVLADFHSKGKEHAICFMGGFIYKTRVSATFWHPDLRRKKGIMIQGRQRNVFRLNHYAFFDSLEITFHELKRPQFTTLPGTLHLPDSRRHISACRAEYCLRNFPSLYLCSGSHFFLQTMRLLFADVPYFPASVQMPSGKTPFSAYRLICFPPSRSDLRNEAGKSLCSFEYIL